MINVKWKGYNNSFNSWTDKKDSINEYFPKPKSSGTNVKVEMTATRLEPRPT